MISSEEGIRLAKRVAAEQNCSRREAEALIVAGGVQVAGKVVTDPARRVREEQTVLVNRLVSMAALAPMTLCCSNLRTGWPTWPGCKIPPA